MSSTPNPPERPKNPTHYGGEGLYESTGTEAAEALKEQQSDRLDDAKQRSRQALERSSSSMRDFAKRNPVLTLVAFGGVAWLLASLNRRSPRE